MGYELRKMQQKIVEQEQTNEKIKLQIESIKDELNLVTSSNFKNKWNGIQEQTENLLEKSSQ